MSKFHRFADQVMVNGKPMYAKDNWECANVVDDSGFWWECHRSRLGKVWRSCRVPEPAVVDYTPIATTGGPVEPVTLNPEAHNPKHAAGSAKCPLHLVPPVAIIREAEVFKLGAKKYGAYNWRDSAVVRSIYLAAALRHLYAMMDGQDIDPESGQSHAAHVRCCMAILLDAKELGKLVDDRPKDGNAAGVLAELMETVQPTQSPACQAPLPEPPQGFDRVAKK